MDPATLARHALEALKRPLTLKEVLSSVVDFRIDRRKKFPPCEILMIAVCAMIDGAKGPTFGVASLRSVSAASVQQFSVQWEADGSPLPTGRWLLAAGCWNTSAAGRLKVCMVESVVCNKGTGKTTCETRFFISSLPVNPKRALEAIRAHWGLEAMHWILDMDFDEDRSRARREDLAENLAMLRHIVINVLRLDKSVFGGISVKRKELTWDDDKLLRLMIAA